MTVAGLHPPEVMELFADDAGEGRPHHGPGQGQLADARGPEVQVLRAAVELGVGPDRPVAHHGHQVLPGVGGLEATPGPPPVVGGDAVLPPTLDVQRRQVQTKLLARLWRR